MPCRRPTAVKTLLAEQKQRLPHGVDYTIALDTTRAVTEGIREIVETLVIAIVLVIIVVYVFLQGWRATLIPLLAVPVSLVGTFVAVPAVRVFHQHAFAVRPGAGHRPRRGRCDRRGGGGRASHRRRDVAEGCDVQGDGRDLGHRSSASLWCCPPCSFRPRSSPESPGACISSSRSPSRSRSASRPSTR